MVLHAWLLWRKGALRSIACMCLFLAPCFAQDWPEDLADVVDTLFPYITHISNYYVVDENEFSYTNADATIRFINEFDPQSLTLTHKAVTQQEVDKLTKALYALPYITFYAAKRDISTYGACRKKNYLLALSALDKQELKPKERLNMNKVISELDGRCSDLSEGRPYMFYEGACGASTLLFWNALLNPNIIVTKRLAHRHWYPAFYGSEIRGDDAVMYELAKQFEIKNNWKEDVYFRTWVSPWGSYVLLSASFHDKSTYVKITREVVGNRQGRIERNVYNTKNNKKDKRLSQNRTSRYIGYDLTSDVAFAGGRRRVPGLY